MSTVEEKCFAAFSASGKVVWLKRIFSELFDIQLDVTCIFCNNPSCFSLTENPVFHNKSKHIKIKFHYIREMVHIGAVKLQYVETNEQIVDVLTKPLARVNSKYFRERLGVIQNETPQKRE